MQVPFKILYASLGWQTRGWGFQQYKDFLEEFSELTDPFSSSAIEYVSEHLKLNRTAIIDTLKLLQRQLLNDIQRDVQHICVVDENYPTVLKHCSHPPLVLSVLGTVTCLQSLGLGVVGARKITEDSKSWLESEFFEFVSSLSSETQLAIYSGGARGVDQLSHQIALLANAPCVAILPTGFNHIYPSSFQSLGAQILRRGGALISPFAPWQAVRKSLFHYRNQILAGCVQSLLIVQAAARSGTYISAQMAMAEGRELLVVPGHPQQHAYQGNLSLIFEGAAVVRDAQDLQDLVRFR